MLRRAAVLLLIILKVYHDDARPQTYMEMVKGYGYPVEQFKRIRTKDGYLLTLHRIPHGLSSKGQENRPVVLLMHGLLSSSFDFVNMGPGFSISYDLAEAGYDVWMGNARGNKMSRAHEYLSPSFNSKRFWGFSWHEIGYYDLPAMIDFILKKTNQKKLSYIGHSQGTTSFFVMASTRPSYNKKIKIMVALAPVVYMKHLWNPFIQLLSQGHGTIRRTMQLIGWHEFIPGEKLLNLIGRKVCESLAVIRALCASAFFMIGGWDSKQFNKSTIPLILTNVPAGAATRQFVHYAQGVKTGKFRRYDFGMIRNLLKYSKVSPPSYKLKNVTAPIYLVHADNDWLSAKFDVLKLGEKLTNLVGMYRVPHKRFNHFDYLYAIDLKKLVNDHVIAILNKYVNT